MVSYVLSVDDAAARLWYGPPSFLGLIPQEINSYLSLFNQFLSWHRTVMGPNMEFEMIFRLFFRILYKSAPDRISALLCIRTSTVYSSSSTYCLLLYGDSRRVPLGWCIGAAVGTQQNIFTVRSSTCSTLLYEDVSGETTPDYCALSGCTYSSGSDDSSSRSYVINIGSPEGPSELELLYPRGTTSWMGSTAVCCSVTHLCTRPAIKTRLGI